MDAVGKFGTASVSPDAVCFPALFAAAGAHVSRSLLGLALRARL
jgi:hypothetical protein